MTPELEQAYLKGLQDALDGGYAVLEQDGSAVNAVKAAVVILEDNLLFNAGRGSVFSKKGLQEMDAAIMDGSNLDAGALQISYGVTYISYTRHSPGVEVTSIHNRGIHFLQAFF